MANITWPSELPPPMSMEFQPEVSRESFTSPFTGSVQRQENYRRWTARMSWPLLTAAEARVMDGLIEDISGDNALLLPLFHRDQPQSGITAHPGGIVDSSTRLNLGGLPHNHVSALTRGDFITVVDGDNYLLNRVAANVDSDGIGDAFVDLTRPLRLNIVGDTILTIINSPVCRMQVVDRNGYKITTRLGGATSAQLTLREVW
ncbi:MAG: hypothetical protein J4F41_00240 [Alphaproteobacteria bacterium]|nr:hypothetical protein [Alphaproteobacteria bacterium]